MDAASCGLELQRAGRPRIGNCKFEGSNVKDYVLQRAKWQGPSFTKFIKNQNNISDPALRRQDDKKPKCNERTVASRAKGQPSRSARLPAWNGARACCPSPTPSPLPLPLPTTNWGWRILTQQRRGGKVRTASVSSGCRWRGGTARPTSSAAARSWLFARSSRHCRVERWWRIRSAAPVAAGEGDEDEEWRLTDGDQRQEREQRRDWRIFQVRGPDYLRSPCHCSSLCRIFYVFLANRPTFKHIMVHVQGWAKVLFPGLVKSVPAVAFYFRLN